MRKIAIILATCLSGCVSNSYRTEPRLTPQEALGSLFLMTAITGGESASSDFLATVYPLRSQMVTFAVIGFHRDRGAWPTSGEQLLSYAESSPANPTLSRDAVSGFATVNKEDGSLEYSTLEDRQRGRVFTISPAYHVTFPIPNYPFATEGSATARPSNSVKMSFDWGAAIAQALMQLAAQKK